jgi:hypothetical protein
MKAAVVPQYDLEDSDEVHPGSLIVRSDWPVPSLHDVESRHDEGDVLVQVAASSVNPIDSMLRRGYGRALLEATAQGRSRLPFIPGFDVAGTSDTKLQQADDDDCELAHHHDDHGVCRYGGGCGHWGVELEEGRRGVGRRRALSQWRPCRVHRHQSGASRDH